jgi:AmmeMemoRadiSam system protein B
MAGKAYPKDPLELAVMLGKYFKDPKGPGKELASSAVKGSSLVGLVSPHIDFERGGPLYAWSYQALSECPRPDVIVAIGVAHSSPNSPWVLTKKEFETPYGPLKVDDALYKDIAASLWYTPTEEEAAHRLEHSLEFQALWLKYLYRENTPTWVPILCSSFDRFCPDRAPSTIDTIETALVAMGRAIQKQKSMGRNVLILAGVDLSHVGPRFGDEKEMNPDLKNKIEQEDKASLDLFFKGQWDDFYLSVVKEKHWRKWCGLSALYTAGRLIQYSQGDELADRHMLAYGQADDPLGGVVSFASGVIYGTK